MDRKQVIKNVTKYKTPVFIIGFALLIVIILTCLFKSAERREKEQQALIVMEKERMADEQRQMSDMADYLDEIDNTVITNAERLAEASLVQMEAERMLQESSKSLTGLEESILYVENLIGRQMEKQTGWNSEVLLYVEAISVSQQEIRSQIADANTSVSFILSELQAANGKGFAHILENIKELQDTMVKTEEQAKGYYDSLESLIALLQEENSEEHASLLKGLFDAKVDILTFLDGWSSDMGIHMEEAFDALMEKMVALHEGIMEAKTTITALLELMEEGDAQRQEEIRGAFSTVALSLEQIKEGYTEAHTEISSLIQKLGEEGAINHKETLSALRIMESNMEKVSMEGLVQVTDSLRHMEENFSATVDNMKHEVTQNLSNLSNEIAKNISEYSAITENRFDQLDDSVTNISGIGNEINELSKNISTYNSSMTDMLRQLNVDITNQYQNLSNTVNRYDAGQQESIDNLMKALEQKLQQVFQFVSSGKRNLASALLTKGISINEDATFSEICNGILAIPQELLIGVQEIPGNITYDYHYHMDKDGNISHAESEPASGGCYTLPVYHIHTGNSQNGGGCYTIPVMHNHTDSCYTVTQVVRRVTAKWFTGQGTGHACCASGYGQNWAKYTYVEETYVNNELVSSIEGGDDLGYCCGICFERKAEKCAYTRTYTDINCGYTEGLNGYELGCGKSGQAIEKYAPGCGLADGQIIGAHIIYDRDALRMPNVISMEETYGTLSSAGEEKRTVSGNLPKAGGGEDMEEVAGEAE